LHKFGADGMVHNVNKKHWRLHSSTENGSVETVLHVFIQSPRSLYGNALVRLVFVKPVFITYCRTRTWIWRRGVWSIHPHLLI
jgi:hypothetical protein